MGQKTNNKMGSARNSLKTSNKETYIIWDEYYQLMHGDPTTDPEATVRELIRAGEINDISDLMFIPLSAIKRMKITYELNEN